MTWRECFGERGSGEKEEEYDMRRFEVGVLMSVDDDDDDDAAVDDVVVSMAMFVVLYDEIIRAIERARLIVCDGSEKQGFEVLSLDVR
jgi:hypothetical protein